MPGTPVEPVKPPVTRVEIAKRLDAYSQFDSPEVLKVQPRPLTPEEQTLIRQGAEARANFAAVPELNKIEVAKVQAEVDAIKARELVTKTLAGPSSGFAVMILPIGLLLIGVLLLFGQMANKRA